MCAHDSDGFREALTARGDYALHSSRGAYFKSAIVDKFAPPGHLAAYSSAL